MQKLLLVDDDPNDLVLFAAALDQVGLNISLETAADGHQAIQLLEGRGQYAERSVHPIPDLILLDLAMSTRDGLDFLAWRRASRSFTNIPVFLYTGCQDKVLLQRALALGVDRYIAKPHKFEDLKSLVWDVYKSGLKPHLNGTPKVPKLDPAFSSTIRQASVGPGSEFTQHE
jgi:CheY-like chemotaxis protein